MNSTNNKGQSDIIPESVISIPSQQLEMKDYNKYDHTHCFNQKESPCGIKGIHRCCLCLEPSPQLEEKEKCLCDIDNVGGNCKYCADWRVLPSQQLESINNYTEDNESIKNSDKSILSQPEEWESRFYNEFTVTRYSQPSGTPVIVFKSIQDAGRILSFIKTEILKAEERGKEFTKEALRPFVYDRPIDSVYNQAITDALEALPDEEDIVQNGNVRSWNYAISEARASLEALKK